MAYEHSVPGRGKGRTKLIRKQSIEITTATFKAPVQYFAQCIQSGLRASRSGDFPTQSQSTRGNTSIPSKPQATNNDNSNSMWELQTAKFLSFSLVRSCVIEHTTTQINSVGSRSWIKPNWETNGFHSKFFQYAFQTMFRHITHAPHDHHGG